MGVCQKKDDETHLVLHIKTQNEINIVEFFALNRIFNIVDEFCKKEGIDGRTDEIIMKIQMESPGSIRLSSKRISTIFLVGMSILCINGGGLKFRNESVGVNFDLSTKGLIENFSDYWDRQADRDMKKSIQNAIDSLEIKSPEDLKCLLNILQEQNSIRKSY